MSERLNKRAIDKKIDMGEDVVNVGIALFEQGRNRVTGVDDDMNPETPQLINNFCYRARLVERFTAQNRYTIVFVNIFFDFVDDRRDRN